MSEYDQLKKGEKGAWISIFAYLFLSTIKLLVAYIGMSEALFADGLNNATDVIASVAVLIGLKISRKPPDSDHHYGHFRAETIASLVAAFIMITVGLDVIVNTIHKLIDNSVKVPDMLTAWTALGAALIMYGVYRFNLQLSKKIKSKSLQAAAQDNRSDALVSIGAFIGIIGAKYGVYWLDPVAGLIVGLIICKTAVDIFFDASHALTDGFDEQKLDELRNSISNDEEVKYVEDIKARVHGNQTLVEATILVNPELSISEGHEITDRIEEILEKKHDVKYAHIHVEPYKEKPKKKKQK